MRVRLVVDEHEVELGWEALESLVNNLPGEDESLAHLYSKLARSSIAGVRRAVAQKSAIPAETVAILTSDSNPEVIEALVGCQCSKLTESAVFEIIQRDWIVVNQQIAQNVEAFDQCDITALANLLAGSADPSVRAALASGFRAPKAVVRRLLNDSDPEVRRAARERLKSR